MRKLLALLVLLPALAAAQVSIWTSKPGGYTGIAAGSSGAMCGTTAFAPCIDLGTMVSAQITISRVDTPLLKYMTIGYDGSATRLRLSSQGIISFSNSPTDAVTTTDILLSRDGAGNFAQKNGTNAQTSTLYFSTTGPVNWATTARTAGAVYTATGGAAQVSYVQTTVPTITTNGGTTPVCVGTDTAMTCTEGTAPPAAATFTVTFNGTWPAAPSCIALRGTAGATPLVQNVVTSTTTVQVNLSANLVASEKFHIHCMGVS